MVDFFVKQIFGHISRVSSPVAAPHMSRDLVCLFTRCEARSEVGRGGATKGSTPQLARSQYPTLATDATPLLAIFLQQLLTARWRNAICDEPKHQ